MSGISGKKVHLIMAVRYTLEERVQMVYMYGAHPSFEEVSNEFHVMFPDRPRPHRTTVRRIIQKFNRTGSVLDIRHKERLRPATNDDASIDLLGHVEVFPRMSTSERAHEAGMSQSSVDRILKRNKYHGYQYENVQELHGDDFEHREQFCGWFINQEIQIPEFALNIMSSDESSFYLSGAVHTKNRRYWSDINPHVFQEAHLQNNPRLNVWCALYRDQLIGPYFIDGNLDGMGYLNLLNDVLRPFLDELPLQRRLNFYFQQDGAPPHFSRVVRAWLDVYLPGRWIGRGGPIPWPARSPDLSPQDFFLWGYLKSKVYEDKPASLEELRDRIREACATVTSDMILRVVDEWGSRVGHCFAARGQHFEHVR